MRGITVALSGGGHRASLFGLGVLLYLRDAGKLPEVTSVASVSGGSLTNGFFAQTIDLATVDDGAAFERAVAPFAKQLAQHGTLFASWTTCIYLVILCLTGVAATVVPWLLPVAGVPQFLVFLVALLLWARRGRLRGTDIPSRYFSVMLVNHPAQSVAPADGAAAYGTR